MKQRDWLVPGHSLGDFIPASGEVCDVVIYQSSFYPIGSGWPFIIEFFVETVIHQARAEGVEAVPVRTVVRKASGKWNLAVRFRILKIIVSELRARAPIGLIIGQMNCDFKVPC